MFGGVFFLLAVIGVAVGFKLRADSRLVLPSVMDWSKFTEDQLLAILKNGAYEYEIHLNNQPIDSNVIPLPNKRTPVGGKKSTVVTATLNDADRTAINEILNRNGNGPKKRKRGA